MIKNLNIKISILIVISIIFIIIPNVSAHPPTKLSLNYNKSNSELIVNITHSVTNDNHYIEWVNISINGLKFENYEYDIQQDRSFITYKYDISADINDVIQVKATCNQFGSITRELTVDENNGSSTPGFIFISIIISCLLIILIRYKKN
jgi:hypothetical protein